MNRKGFITSIEWAPVLNSDVCESCKQRSMISNIGDKKVSGLSCSNPSCEEFLVPKVEEIGDWNKLL